MVIQIAGKQNKTQNRNVRKENFNENFLWKTGII